MLRLCKRSDSTPAREVPRPGYGFLCWCPGCRHWASCDPAMLVRNGLGDRDPLRCRPRCRTCGSIGAWQLRAPTPEFGGFTHYGMQQRNPGAWRELNHQSACVVYDLSVGRDPSNDLTVGAGWRIRPLKMRPRVQTGDKYMRKTTTLAGAVVLLSLTSGSAFSQVIYRLTELDGLGFSCSGRGHQRIGAGNGL